MLLHSEVFTMSDEPENYPLTVDDSWLDHHSWESQQAGRQTGSQTDSHTDKQTDKQTDWQAGRQRMEGRKIMIYWSTKQIGLVGGQMIQTIINEVFVQCPCNDGCQRTKRNLYRPITLHASGGNDDDWLQKIIEETARRARNTETRWKIIRTIQWVKTDRI